MRNYSPHDTINYYNQKFANGNDYGRLPEVIYLNNESKEESTNLYILFKNGYKGYEDLQYFRTNDYFNLVSTDLSNSDKISSVKVNYYERIG